MDDCGQGNALEQLGRGRRGDAALAVGDADRPVPVGTGEATIWSTPNRSQPTAVPTMSAIESAAPTSWKWTCSIAVPWTLASASASRVKIRRASLPGLRADLAGIDQGQDVVQVPVDVLRLVLDADLGGAEALLADLLGDQPHLPQAQRGDRVVEDRQVDAGVDQGAEHHVAADARSTVQVGQFHDRGSLRKA